jgi:hypothetical protein
MLGTVNSKVRAPVAGSMRLRRPAVRSISQIRLSGPQRIWCGPSRPLTSTRMLNAGPTCEEASGLISMQPATAEATARTAIRRNGDMRHSFSEIWAKGQTQKEHSRPTPGLEPRRASRRRLQALVRCGARGLFLSWLSHLLCTGNTLPDYRWHKA